ncbi:hypothetical protein [Microbispora sp. H13382]|uniref:hypothetical protein n=1 Tax=Microbispora sp. H13382 TaxID=2729112 RepID=UPI0015FFA1F4|nr:hypothetical protein [Microbispora sp. H13382]
MLQESAEAAGLDRGIWDRQPEGDGEVAVISPECDLSGLVGLFIRTLEDRLALHNEDHAPGTQIRLRVAMHIGLLKRASLGYASPALVTVNRLLNADVLRTALRETEEADLALLVSPEVHQVVEAGVDGLRPRRFREVFVEDPAKGFASPAYLYLAGGTQPRPAAPAGTRTGSPSAPGTPSPAATSVYGQQWNVGPNAHIQQSQGPMYITDNRTGER